MSNTIGRLLRAAATATGAVALGVALVGTAGATPLDSDTDSGAAESASDEDGDVLGYVDPDTVDPDYAGAVDPGKVDPGETSRQKPDLAQDNLDGETESPRVQKPGLLNVEAPRVKTG